MSARSVARAAAWPVVQVGKGVAFFAVWVWYMFLTSWPPTHAWMHMRDERGYHSIEPRHMDALERMHALGVDVMPKEEKD